MEVMELAIEELEWSLQGSDEYIKRCWEDVQRCQRYASDYHAKLIKAYEDHKKALERKESFRKALEVLRAAK